MARMKPLGSHQNGRSKPPDTRAFGVITRRLDIGTLQLTLASRVLSGELNRGNAQLSPFQG
jgi:hypothetical protein